MMDEKRLPPFITSVEIVRTIANAFDVKHANKRLDDMALKTDVDYRLIGQLVKESIKEPVAKYINVNASGVIFESCMQLITEYMRTVGTTSLDCVPLCQSLPLLLESYFPKHASALLTKLNENFGGPNPVVFVSNNERAVNVAIKWIENNEDGWKEYFKGCNREQQQRISAWSSGTDLPSSQSIYLMQKWSNVELNRAIDWNRISVLLFVARSIDWIRRKEFGAIFIDSLADDLRPKHSIVDFDLRAELLHRDNQKRYRVVFPLLAEIHKRLLRTRTKMDCDKEETYQYIQAAKSTLERIDEYASLSYSLDWHEAIWSVFAGDITRACAKYKDAFEGSLYRSGENQKHIIEESLVVAASQDRPDKVFLKRLKNMAIALGYEIPIQSTGSNIRINKTSDFIEDWEVNHLSAHFRTVFPEKGWFPGVKYSGKHVRLGPLILDGSDQVNPDFRHQDRRIKVGATWKKTMPQLVWFTQQEKMDIVKRLLENGADVDAFSDSGETAILMAIEALNVTTFPVQSLDLGLFNLISKYEHKSATLNKTTAKKRLLPIISAVHSGNPVVVAKLLDMGANSNCRGLTDNQTALNVCLKYIGFLKNPVKFWDEMDKHPITPELLDGIRRHTAGMSGFTLEQQDAFMKTQEAHPLYRKFRQAIKSIITESVSSNMNFKNLRDIATLLIEHGADPNAEHFSPLKGYTPLMLAAELNERNLFDQMLIKGGDPLKTHMNPRNGERQDCWDIARYFKSKHVLDALDAVKDYFKADKLIH